MKSRTTGTIIVLVLAAVGTAFLTLSRSACVEAVYPVENANRTFRQKVLSRISGFFHGAAARAENVRLKREVAAYSLLRGDLERLETENARLRRALEYTARELQVWVPAGVLSSGGASAKVAATLRVDKGSLAGIREGAVVVVPEGLVGRVTAVTPHTSEILLVTDESLKVDCTVECEGNRKPRGVLCGGSGDLLRLRYLTNAEEVPPRSRVLTSGAGGVFPAGIEVGTLLDVRKDAKGLAREGEVLPTVDYSTLEDVFIRRAK